MKRPTLATIIGLGILATGAVGGTLTRSDLPEKDEHLIKEYFQASKKLIIAQDKFSSTKVLDKDYIPQSDRKDYSFSQAHSETEKAYQNLQVAKLELKTLEEQPQVKTYLEESRLSNGLYLSAIAGLVLGLLGLSKSDRHKYFLDN